MSRINTNVLSLIAQRTLGSNNKSLNSALEHLSTGLRINRGKDDPAGLIASENLRAEKSSINAAIGNADRADQVANIAEGGLQEVSNLLTDLQGLVTTTANGAGLSDQEKSANQLQIDSILQTIDRISDATNFQGKKLLNGGLDFTVTNVAGGVTDYKVNGAKLGHNATLAVQAVVTTSAQKAGTFLSTGGALNLGTGSAFVIEVNGSLGSRELSFASGTTVAQIVAAINTFTDVTGVAATASATGLRLDSSKFGASNFVSVKVVDDGDINSAVANAGIYTLETADTATADVSTQVNFNATAAATGVRDLGQDVVATVNGIAATSDGKTIRVNTDFLNVELTLDDSTARTAGAVDAFTISGGGADFQLASSVDIAGKVSIGVSDVSARKLGNSSLGYLADLASGKANNVVSGDLTAAQKIVSEAINQISSARGRLGAFQKNTVGATIRNLGVSLENTTAAESVIRDSDFASETASLTRGQILASAATQVLSLANSQPQQVLQLLG